VIEATQDTHEDEEHIPPSADEDEDDGDPANDTEEGQGEADQGQGGVEEQQPNDTEGRMPGQLAPNSLGFGVLTILLFDGGIQQL
jgi:hypothetical protein